MINTKDVDAAIVWVTRRIFDRPKQGHLHFIANRAVLVGDVLVTSAHVCAGGAGRIRGIMMADNGPILSSSHEPWPLGSDPDMTVAFDRPEPADTIARMRQFPVSRLRAEGAQRLLAGPGEMRVHPLFADPYTDVAVLADHPDAPGALAAIRRERTALSLRWRPINGLEQVYVRGMGGWGRGLARRLSGPSARLAVMDDVFRNGDCGGPVVDELGALVGVGNVGLTEPGETFTFGQAALAQLCLALPPWILERIGESTRTVTETESRVDRETPSLSP